MTNVIKCETSMPIEWYSCVVSSTAVLWIQKRRIEKRDSIEFSSKSRRARDDR